MFPDSDIAPSFGQLCKQEMAYIISHGLATYFKRMSMEKLSPPGSRSTPLFVSCFDKSLNKVTYSKHMDIHVIFFDVAKLSVEQFYIGSQFMGHATH